MKKIIVITGASSGLGVCFARQLAKESADYRFSGKEELASDEIWLIARRKDRLEQTMDQLKQDSEEYNLTHGKTTEIFYPKTRIFSMDISGQAGADAVRDLFDEENRRKPIGFNSKDDPPGIKILVLVNNAGFGTYGEFANTDVKRQMEMVDLDCTSLTGITGYALPYIYENSRIINTASLAAYAPLGNFAVYAASKAYVLNFTAALRAELKPKGIKVTALCPGSVSTEFANVASNGARKEVKHGLSPEKTVAHCIRCSRKGKLVSMKFFKWKVKAFLSTFAGRKLVAWATYKFDKRPANPF